MKLGRSTALSRPIMDRTIRSSIREKPFFNIEGSLLLKIINVNIVFWIIFF